MKNICVFCGSGIGNNPIYKREAQRLARVILQHKLQLVYGGGNIGLMGTIADEMIANGGFVTGVIPEFLMKKEVGHTGISKMHIVNSMHERKHLMASISDGFVAMPGGLGTLEELGEIMTWIQLELVKKPIGLFNINGFYDSLIAQLDHMTKEGFLKIETRNNLLVSSNPEELITQILEFQFDDFSIWQDLDRT